MPFRLILTMLSGKLITDHMEAYVSPMLNRAGRLICAKAVLKLLTPIFLTAHQAPTCKHYNIKTTNTGTVNASNIVWAAEDMKIPAFQAPDMWILTPVIRINKSSRIKCGGVSWHNKNPRHSPGVFLTFKPLYDLAH